MALVNPIRIQDNRKGWTVAAILHILVLLAFWLWPMDMPELDPPKIQNDEVMMIMDFSDAGGEGASGGSENHMEEVQNSAPESEENTSEESAEESTATQEESPVSTPESSNSSSSDGNGESSQNDNPLISGNPFAGSGGGTEGGSGGGSGDFGGGTGSIGNSFGEGGDGRTVKYKPQISNPTQEVGTVMVEVIIRPDGSIKSAKYLANHSLTTITSPTLLKMAQDAAMKFKFNKEDTDKLQTTRIGIKFSLD